MKSTTTTTTSIRSPDKSHRRHHHHDHHHPRLTITLPMESNPIISRVTAELQRLRTWEESSTSAAETISIGLFGVGDLYKCAAQFLASPLTQQGLSITVRTTTTTNINNNNNNNNNQYHNCVDDLLEESGNLLQLCSASRTIASQLIEASRTLRSGLHLQQECQKGYEDMIMISAYVRSRKEVVNEAKKLMIASFYRSRHGYSSSPAPLDRTVAAAGDHSCLSVVMKVLRCVGIISESIYEALLCFLSMRVIISSSCYKRKKKSGSRVNGISLLLSKLLAALPKENYSYYCYSSPGKDLEFHNHTRWNELDRVDAAINTAVWSNDNDVRLVCKRLEALEDGLDGIHNGLDSIFRELSQIRSYLLKFY